MRMRRDDHRKAGPLQAADRNQFGGNEGRQIRIDREAHKIEPRRPQVRSTLGR